MKAIFSRPLLTTWTSCARACFISALLLFCFLAPCSARADSTEVFPEVEFDSETLQAVTNLARAFTLGSSASSTPTLEDNVASILNLLNLIEISTAGASKFYTLPTFEADGRTGSLGGLFGRLFYEGGTVDWPPRVDKSYFFEIQRALYGQSGVPNADSSVIPLLLHLYGVTTNELPSINATTTDIDHVVDGLLASFLQLSDEYFYGAHSYAWDVHLDDSSVGAISDSFDWLGGYLSNVVEHVGADMGGYLSNIDPYVSDIASAVDAEYETGHMADEYEVSDEYIPDDLSASSNDLVQLEIEPGELPNVYHILDGVDARDFNMLPSLTGADPVIEVFRAERSSNLPAFSIDFSVPPGIYNLIILFCTWLWRVLFFVSMWRLVEGEYNYWTTLGGGA